MGGQGKGEILVKGSMRQPRDEDSDGAGTAGSRSNAGDDATVVGGGDNPRVLTETTRYV